MRYPLNPPALTHTLVLTLTGLQVSPSPWPSTRDHSNALWAAHKPTCPTQSHLLPSVTRGRCDRSNALWIAQKAIDTFGAQNVVEEFQRTFEEGMDDFVSGNWGASKTCFEKALSICPRDKPSERILMHMNTHDNYPDYGYGPHGLNQPSLFTCRRASGRPAPHGLNHSSLFTCRHASERRA